jgi:hypothetical protein
LEKVSTHRKGFLSLNRPIYEKFQPLDCKIYEKVGFKSILRELGTAKIRFSDQM